MTQRHPRHATFAFWLAALCAALSFAPAQAQSSAPELRARLAKLNAEQAGRLPQSAFESIAYQLDVADRIERGYPEQAVAWRARASKWLDLAAKGSDPVVAQRGQIVMRGYMSRVSSVRQGYAVYVPKDYDPARAYPLMLVMHGGSANGNLFLGVVLGNNMNWKQYDAHLWDEFTPRWPPEWIVVAPDGFGQVMWRWMGEQDLLDVLDDVQHNYHVDDNRVVLCGLSNGGVGAYNIGLRHAWRFSAVLAISGAPSWLQYAGGRTDTMQTDELAPLSGMSLAENAINTDFRYFHGRLDPGPMRPAYVQAFTKQIAQLGVPFHEQWYDAGHDLLYLVHQYGSIYKKLETIVRNPHPKEVRVVTGDYRANRQHWVTVTRIERLPSLARVRALVDRERLRVETTNTAGLLLTLSDAPLGTATHLALEVDGQVVFDGARSALGANLALARNATGRWQLGTPSAGSAEHPVKQAGSAGPLTDAYFDSVVHVYGTQNAADTATLRKAAEHGARGWPLWLWRVDQKVVADTELTDQQLRDNHVVLYATPGSNAVLSKIEARLPIRATAAGVRVGDHLFAGAGVGVRFVYPNPLAPGRYVIVQSAPTADAVDDGNNLPDFLPDYAVYDARTTAQRQRLLFSDAQPPLAIGYFDNHWQLDGSHVRMPAPRAGNPAHATASKHHDARQPAAPNDGNDPESAEHDVSHSKLPVAPAPGLPPPPQHFAASADSPAGKAAREIARRVQTFTNYRSKIPGATWRIDDTQVWSVRDESDCLADLQAQGVHVRHWDGALTTPVPVPVRVTAPIEGVTFQIMHAGPGGVVSCELAARMIDVAHVMKKHGIHTVYVLSAYRDHPYPSFHTLGLALDMSRFDGADGPLVVKTDFVIDHDHETCAAPASATTHKKARALLEIACDLAETHRFSSVLTPNYNVGHRDHFHVDVRPDDPRLFVR